jgi:hypothetical protein
MHIQIANLPIEITASELRNSLLNSIGTIERVFLLNQSSKENVVALVKLNCSRAEINSIASKLNGKFFHKKLLLVYPLLFFI